MPGQVFTSTEYHTTFAVSSTLKSFCGGRSITLVNTSVGSPSSDRASTEKRSGVVMSDEGHIVRRGEIRGIRGRRGRAELFTFGWLHALSG